MARRRKLLCLPCPYAWIHRGHDNRHQTYSLGTYSKCRFRNIAIAIARDCYGSDFNALRQSSAGDCYQGWVRGRPQCLGRNIAGASVLSESPSGCELLGSSREDGCVGWANADGYDILSRPKELAATARKRQEW
jgi:hypothetical protein